MKRTGSLLKKAREEKGLSLNEIGLSLKISSKVLRAIEEGDEAQLPAKTFLRGFVKSYATYLRLDADEVLKIFQEEMGSTSPKPYIRPTNTPVTNEESTEQATSAPVAAAATNESPRNDKLHSLNETKNTKAIIASVVVIVLIGLIVFTKRMIDKYSKEAEVTAGVEQTLDGLTPVSESANPEAPTEEAAEAVAVAPTSAPMSVASPSPSPLASPVASATPTATATPVPSVTPTPKPSPSPTPVASATPTVTPKPSPSPVASPVAAAAPSPTATPSPTPVASPSATPTPTPTPTPKEEKPKPVELIVEAMDSVEIEYSAANGKSQKIRLSADQVHTFKSRSGLKVTISNGGAVNLILNGRDLGIPGDLGKSIKLSY